MDEPPIFDESPEAPRRVLHLGGELSSLEVWASRVGFRLHIEDQSPTLIDEPPVTRTSEWLNWEELWQAMSVYRWVRLRVLNLDRAIYSSVERRAREALSAEPGNVRSRWDECWQGFVPLQ